MVVEVVVVVMVEGEVLAMAMDIVMLISSQVCL
jgi:hypothetical protein